MLQHVSLGMQVVQLQLESTGGADAQSAAPQFVADNGTEALPLPPGVPPLPPRKCAFDEDAEVRRQTGFPGPLQALVRMSLPFQNEPTAAGPALIMDRSAASICRFTDG